MVTSTLEALELTPDFPELFGRRVLVTGVQGEIGAEVVRLVAEQKVRLVLQAPEISPEIDALAEMVGADALDVRLFTGRRADAHATLCAVRSAAQSFGGLDAVINLAHVVAPDDASQAAVETAVAATLSLPCLVTRIAANRMRTMLTPGAIATVLVLPRGASTRQRMVASVARATLAALTRREAAEWAPHGIRINAVAPDTGLPGAGRNGAGGLTGAADLATLALHLVSERGHRLSGLVLDGAGA